jgi:hypothetical protein
MRSGRSQLIFTPLDGLRKHSALPMIGETSPKSNAKLTLILQPRMPNDDLASDVAERAPNGARYGLPRLSTNGSLLKPGKCRPIGGPHQHPVGNS